ncbi:MAG: hypothetical protein WC692_04245 [Erythrobacter sp.]|jgi:hypothetical protein
MEDGLFTHQGKKLMLIGFFLWCVAMLIGDEDDPGMIAQVSEGGADGLVSHEPGVDEQAYVPPPQAARVEARPPQDASLDAWYAEAAPNEVVNPEPVDESHLIDDTQPVVSAEPQVR